MTNSDPRGLWQNQQTEGQTMSVDNIRAMLQRRRAQTRWRRWLFGTAFILYLALSVGGKKRDILGNPGGTTA